MNKIGIIADDMTGATTVGVLLARAGVRTAAYFDLLNATHLDELDAIVLSSDSRALDKESAQREVKKAMQSLKSMGANYYSKRIDTTLRGGIGFEVDAMLEEMEVGTIAIMVPAMPQSNRILVGGYSVIDGVALSKTQVARDVRTPIKESHVPTMYAKQTNRKIGQVGLASILAGKEYIKSALIEQRENGATVIIVDAIKLEDVDLIAEAVVELKWSILAIDPGPFSTALSKLWGLNTNPSIDNVDSLVEIGNEDGIVIAGVGSATTITKKQISALQDNSYVASVSVNPVNLINQETQEQEIKKSFESMKAMLKNDHIKIGLVETALGHDVLDLDEVEKEYGLDKGEAAKRINTSLGEIINMVIREAKSRREVKGLYVTGGDTMISILKTIGATGIFLKDYVIPQTDLGHILGGEFEGMAVIGKGGLTGKEDTAISAINRIFYEYKINNERCV